MRKYTILLLCLLVIVGSATARHGVELMLKGGMIDNYSQGNLNLPTYNVENLSSFGGQLKISRLPAVDLVIGADYSWRGRDYEIEGQILNFKVRDFAITASLVYPLKLKAFELYAGAGVGSHSISYAYRRPGTLILEDYGVEIPGSSPFFGYHGLVGGKANLVSDLVGLFVEMRIYQIDAPFDDISYNSWSAGITLSLE